MTLVQLPIPDKYEYLDVDKIVYMEFNAYDGKLTIDLGETCVRVYYEGAKRILDKIIEVSGCQDGVPKIPKKEKLVSVETTYYEANDICDLIT